MYYNNTNEYKFKCELDGYYIWQRPVVGPIFYGTEGDLCKELDETYECEYVFVDQEGVAPPSSFSGSGIGRECFRKYFINPYTKAEKESGFYVIDDTTEGYMVDGGGLSYNTSAIYITQADIDALLNGKALVFGEDEYTAFVKFLKEE